MLLRCCLWRLFLFCCFSSFSVLSLFALLLWPTGANSILITALTQEGNVKAAIDTCVLLNEWDQVKDLALSDILLDAAEHRVSLALFFVFCSGGQSRRRTQLPADRRPSDKVRVPPSRGQKSNRGHRTLSKGQQTYRSSTTAFKGSCCLWILFLSLTIELSLIARRTSGKRAWQPATCEKAIRVVRSRGKACYHLLDMSLVFSTRLFRF